MFTVQCTVYNVWCMVCCVMFTVHWLSVRRQLAAPRPVHGAPRPAAAAPEGHISHHLCLLSTVYCYTGYYIYSIFSNVNLSTCPHHASCIYEETMIS